jgi:hypothetical protein
MSRSLRSLVAIVALVSALLFTAVAVGQYLFVIYQLHESREETLKSWAGELRDDIAFEDAWNLQGYRRSTEGPDTYVILTATGAVVDTHGYLPGMVGHVSLPFRFEFERPFEFSSEVGEVWALYVHKLRDGMVILGVRVEVTPQNLQERFVTNAARFGSTVAEAADTRERAIDESFDWAVIDLNGNVRWAIGGIPMKSSVPEIPDKPGLISAHRIGTGYYASYVQPIKSKSGKKVGVIKVLEDVTDEQQVLRQVVEFNALVSLILWFITLAFAVIYLRRTRVAEITCAQIPLLQESDTVEFKSSLRWNYQQNKRDAEMERAVVKTVAGFLNSYGGGNLIIGLGDKGEVLGLQPDYSTLNRRPNRDGFEQALRNVLITAFGEAPCAAWIKVSFCSLQDNDLCMVKVSPATEPIYPKEKGAEDAALYVRLGNTTTPLSAREAVAYSRERWGGVSLRRSYLRRSAMQPAA